MATQPSRHPNPPRARVLVVDDESNIRAMLMQALTISGYEVETAASGVRALALLQQKPFDLMVLDIMMPEMGGAEVMSRARQLRPELLVVILTGHGSMETAIAGIKAGAVDYLLKPAGIHDIVSAVERALATRSDRVRRSQLLQVMDEAVEALRSLELPLAAPQPAEERFLGKGPFTLDRQKRLLLVEDKPGSAIQLSEGEAAVLDALLVHADQVLSGRALARLAWNYELEEEEARGLLRQYIFRLRQKLGDDPAAPHWIHTIRGRGYLLSTAAPSSRAPRTRSHK